MFGCRRVGVCGVFRVTTGHGPWGQFGERVEVEQLLDVGGKQCGECRERMRLGEVDAMEFE